MTLNAICPRCSEVHLVRFENVIKGTQVSRLFYCGGCDLEWTIEATRGAEPPVIPRPTRGNSTTIRPKRRS